jgi:hypothetical protein
LLGAACMAYARLHTRGRSAAASRILARTNTQVRNSAACMRRCVQHARTQYADWCTCVVHRCHVARLSLSMAAC